MKRFINFIKNIFKNRPQKPSEPLPSVDNNKIPSCTIDDLCDERVPPKKESEWTPENYRQEYIDLWISARKKIICGSNGCQTPGGLVWTMNRIKAMKHRYVNASDFIKKELGDNIPWEVIAALHMRESGSDFSKQIMNGQPWSRITTWVPRGHGPWESWEKSCVDAFKIKDRPKKWTIANTLYFCERFNGMGYRMSGREKIVGHSPYLWAFTQHYRGGYFISDGRFSSSAVAKGVGVAMILKELDFKGE